MKLRLLIVVLAVIVVGTGIGWQYVRTLPVEIIPAEPPGGTGDPGDPTTDPGETPTWPVPTFLRVNHGLTYEPSEASLWLMDYEQFLELIAEALAGIDEPGDQVGELPFEFWGDLDEGAYRISATYDPAFSVGTSEPAEVIDVLLYAASASDEVFLYVRSPAEVWYRFKTSLQAGRLDEYVKTVRERVDAEGG